MICKIDEAWVTMLLHANRRVYIVKIIIHCDKLYYNLWICAYSMGLRNSIHYFFYRHGERFCWNSTRVTSRMEMCKISKLAYHLPAPKQNKGRPTIKLNERKQDKRNRTKVLVLKHLPSNSTYNSYLIVFQSHPNIFRNQLRSNPWYWIFLIVHIAISSLDEIHTLLHLLVENWQYCNFIHHRT